MFHNPATTQSGQERVRAGHPDITEYPPSWEIKLGALSPWPVRWRWRHRRQSLWSLAMETSGSRSLRSLSRPWSGTAFCVSCQKKRWILQRESASIALLNLRCDDEAELHSRIEHQPRDVLLGHAGKLMGEHVLKADEPHQNPLVGLLV